MNHLGRKTLYKGFKMNQYVHTYDYLNYTNRKKTERSGSMTLPGEDVIRSHACFVNARTRTYREEGPRRNFISSQQL